MISDGDLSKIVVDSEVIHKFMAFVILGPIAIIPASIAIKAHTDDQ
ncbi:TMhelix containing protein [Vibrio phage 2.275.O._10N.286.54.E11]|nr:TMhelix containing protein [Vibrio phage 2.275.O._10N.286.54.E11]